MVRAFLNLIKRFSSADKAMGFIGLLISFTAILVAWQSTSTIWWMTILAVLFTVICGVFLLLLFIGILKKSDDGLQVMGGAEGSEGLASLEGGSVLTMPLNERETKEPALDFGGASTIPASHGANKKGMLNTIRDHVSHPRDGSPLAWFEGNMIKYWVRLPLLLLPLVFLFMMFSGLKGFLEEIHREEPCDQLLAKEGLPSFLCEQELKNLALRKDLKNYKWLQMLSVVGGTLSISLNSPEDNDLTSPPLKLLPNLPPKLFELTIEGAGITNLTNLGENSKLEKLNILSCNKLESLQGIERISNLKHLYLADNSTLSHIDGLSKLKGLKSITIIGSPKLRVRNYEDHLDHFSLVHGTIEFQGDEPIGAQNIANMFSTSMESMVSLRLINTDFPDLEFAHKFSSLRNLSVENNVSDDALRLSCLPLGAEKHPEVNFIRLYLKNSQFKELGKLLGQVNSLNTLYISKVPEEFNIRELDKGQYKGLETLYLEDWNSKQTMSLKDLSLLSETLKTLAFVNVHPLKSLDGVLEFTRLEALILSSNAQLNQIELKRLSGIGAHLQSTAKFALVLSDYKDLTTLSVFHGKGMDFSSVSHLVFTSNSSKLSLTGLDSFPSLETLFISTKGAINNESELLGLKNIEKLHLMGEFSFQTIFNSGSGYPNNDENLDEVWTGLEELVLINNVLRELPPVYLFPKLDYMYLGECNELNDFSNLINYKSLRKLHVLGAHHSLEQVPTNIEVFSIGNRSGELPGHNWSDFFQFFNYKNKTGTL